jgi:hypothetical protein
MFYRHAYLNLFSAPRLAILAAALLIISVTLPGLGVGASPTSALAKEETRSQDHLVATTVTLAYSSYFGGSLSDGGNSVAVDGEGNIYLVGTTSSASFPTANAYQASLNGTSDAFVAKFDPTGTTLIYSTYLGGSGTDSAAAVGVDAAGNAYIGGRTTSTDFPLHNAYQPTYGGFNSDGFVAKLNPSGTALLYSTYLGGSAGESVVGIAVDGSGNAYVTGSTSSLNFPVKNAYQRTCATRPNTCTDGFVTKLNPNGSGAASLLYSTYVGGGSSAFEYNWDFPMDIAVDDVGRASITGQTYATGFPTRNAFQTRNGGFIDAFVTKLSAAGNSLIFSTYMGGTGGDQGLGIAADSAGNTYVTGSAGSVNFPVRNAMQPTLRGGSDTFIAKFGPSGGSPVYSTFFGGMGGDVAYGITVDSSGTPYLIGQTNSTDFPLLNSLQTSGGLFVTRLNSAGSGLLFSSFFGGTGSDEAQDVAVDGSGSIYLSGNTTSTDFPTAGAYQPTNAGGGDAFIAKIVEP